MDSLLCRTFINVWQKRRYSVIRLDQRCATNERYPRSGQCHVGRGMESEAGLDGVIRGGRWVSGDRSGRDGWLGWWWIGRGWDGIACNGCGWRYEQLDLNRRRLCCMPPHSTPR